METGLGTSSNGKGEFLFCGWKNLAKKFERVLRLYTWKSCFLIKKIDFLALNTDFPVKKSNFLVKKIDFLDNFTVRLRMSHILARRMDTSPFPYGDRFSH
jgi:hypothetical protein